MAERKQVSDYERCPICGALHAKPCPNIDRWP